MQLIYALTSFLTLISAAPTGTNPETDRRDDDCQSKTFDLPWSLTNITIYKAADQKSGSEQAAISFHFCDSNSNLELDTDCSGTVVNDRCEGEDGGYVLCDNDDVSFKFASSLVMLTRYYTDDW